MPESFEKKCAKCSNPFLPHHWQHFSPSTGEVFHTGCFGQYKFPSLLASERLLAIEDYKKELLEKVEGMKKEIQSVCGECGIAANVLTCLKKYGSPPKKLAFDCSTFHTGPCDVCGKQKSVTQARDFFYPDFGLLIKAMNKKIA